MTKTEREARIAELERKYPAEFLKRSLSDDAVAWRTLTAPNASEFDESDNG